MAGVPAYNPPPRARMPRLTRRLTLTLLLSGLLTPSTLRAEDGEAPPSENTAAAEPSIPPTSPSFGPEARVWPAVARSSPLRMGAVEAFRVPRRAEEMGVQWQRVLFDWSVIQRDGPQQWQLGWVDEAMARRERDAGRPVIGQFISTPSWASGTRDAKSPPRGLEYPLDDPRNVWAAWVRAVAARYTGLVDTWVIWNEPDVWSDATGTRQWDGTPEQYYQLLKVASLAAKRANPRATILMAGMTYWWDANYNREQYFSRVLRAAAADPTAAANGWYFDGAVLQLYNNPRGLFDAPRVFRDIMRGYNLEKPVWVNETNVVPWDDPAAPLSRAHYRATMDEQASYLVQATAYSLASGVERLAIYKLLDDANIKKGVEQAFGFVRDDPTNSTRPIFDTFKVVSAEMSPTTRAQLVDEGAIVRVFLEQPALARRMTVAWNMSAQPRQISIPAPPLGGLQAIDKFGRRRPLEPAAEGAIPVTLPPATANTLTGFPDAFFIGGDPVMLVEPLPGAYTPFDPTVSPS